MGKVMKFAEKAKKIKRTAMVSFRTDGEEMIDFVVESRKEKEVDAINAKYEGLKPKVPTKRLPSSGKQPKIVEDPNDPTYKIELAKVQKQNFAELAVLFLAEDERPEGTLEEQIQQVMEVELAGFVPKVVQRGLEISGIIEEEDSYDEDLQEAKND